MPPDRQLPVPERLASGDAAGYGASPGPGKTGKAGLGNGTYVGDVNIVARPEGPGPDAVQLWHEAGPTRHWNYPAQDLRRAMRSNTAAAAFYERLS